MTAFGFYVEANGGVSQSVVTPSNHTVSLYGLGLGVQMRNNNFVMTAGINGVMTNHADIKLNREAKLYGFGSEVVRCELDYDRLYHIEIALNFGYAIGNHTVMLGVRPSYLVGSRVNYVRHEGVSAVSNETYHGYMEGLQRWGVKPTFGYAYQFNSWQVGANIGAVSYTHLTLPTICSV